MKTAIQATLMFLAGVLAACAIGVAIAWTSVEQIAAPWAIERVLHASDVRVASVANVDGALVLDGFALQNEDATLVLRAKRVRVAGGAFGLVAAAFDGAKPLDVALESPHLDVADAALEPDYAKRTLAALRDDDLGGRRVTVALSDGSVTVGDPAEGDRSLSLASVHGTLDLTHDVASYALAGREIARATAYDFAASGTPDGGSTLHRLTASALALQPIFAIVPGTALTVRGGFVRDLDVRVRTSASAPEIAAGGTFVHVGGTLGADGSHGFAEADGRFALRDERLSVPTLTARLGRATLHAYGEVRDLPRSPRWLESGTRELALAARTIAAIESQPDLTELSFDVDAPGIDYAHFHMDDPLGPREISLVAIDPAVPGVRLDTALAEDSIVSGGERTSALATRTQAVAGINGDYFDIGRSYQPQGMLMSDGKLLRSPADRATVAIHRDGSLTFGEYRCSGSLATPRGTLAISEYNDWPAGVGTVVTPAFGKVLRYAAGETFVGLEPVDEARHRYRVTEVTPSAGEMPVRFGVGFGGATTGALPRAGDRVTLAYGCSPSLDGTVAILGGGPQMLKDGDLYDDPHAPAPDEKPVRWPVVAIAAMADKTLAMVAVDGRHPERALGMSRPEFADLLKALGGTDAMALDSGGSVTLVSRRPGDAAPTVRNRPSDEDGERWISDGLFAYSDVPAPSTTEAPAIVPEALDAPAPASTTLETIVNPDLPGNGVVTSPSPAPAPSSRPT